jgi:GNAT superfamily N-acetyltransferase
MQIRLGNRQDEPAITALVQRVMEEFGLSPQPETAESDLKNIEANYFGRDGLFLVAESDKEIVGLAAARRNEEDKLDLERLVVAKDFRGRGIARELMETVRRFAADMAYKRIEVEPARQYPGADKAMRMLGFTSDPTEDAQKLWYHEVDRDFPNCDR